MTSVPLPFAAVRLAAVVALAAAAAGCSTTPGLTAPAAKAPAPAPAPAPAAAAAPATRTDTGTLPFATMKGALTEQGGTLDPFAYSEKPGDAQLGKLSVADGVAQVTGVIWPQKGSTWAGVALSVNAGAAGKTVDLSGYKSVTLQLAGNLPSLRLRIMGADKVVRDSGCYPIVMQPVTTELREYTIELSRFAPEGYCGGNARSIAATQPAVATVEVADAKVSGARRDVAFRVGRIVFNR
ncbi:MAG: hypothetical protein HY856_03185 [Burkholderiales bacterium]|nr:hypothetical protein [Burkholderiales bacterium]